MARCSLLFLLAIPALVGLLVPSCMADNVLYTDESMRSGQSLVYGSFSLIMQTDCNLVLYDACRALWDSNTALKGTNCRATMQSNGNFVVYTGSGKLVWASGTDRRTANYVLVLQRDRNVVIYGPAIWATGTYLEGTVGVVVATNATATAVPVKVAAATDGDLDNRKIAMVTEN